MPSHLPLILLLLVLAPLLASAQEPRDDAPDTTRDLSSRARLQALADSGYFDARWVDEGDSLRIEPGVRYRIGEVRRDGDSLPIATPFLDSLEGAPFSTPVVAAAARELAARLEIAGRPLATIRPVPLVDSARKVVDLVFVVGGSERVLLDGIEVRGNSETRRELIVRGANLPERVEYSTELAAGVRRRLERLELFERVSEPTILRRADGSYALLVEVEEASTNTFDGVVGYQPADSGGEAALTGLISVSMRNLFGSGRRLAFRWQQQTRIGSQLELLYGEPFLFDLPLAVDVGYRQIEDEGGGDSYVLRALDGGLSWGLSDDFVVRLGGAAEWSVPEIDTTLPCEARPSSTTTLEVNGSIRYDSRDNRFNPTRGLVYGTTYGVGSRSNDLGPTCDTLALAGDTRQRAEVEIEGYVPVVGPIVAGASVHYGEVIADRLQESDLLRLGGAATVRGYREGAYRVARRLWGSLEGRLLLGRLSHALLFVDGGYYRGPDAAALQPATPLEGWLLGYGVGLQIETPLGIARISFALGRGDAFATGKVSIGLVNQF